MSVILFPRCGKSYEGALLERLLDLQLPITEFDVEDDFKSYFEAICCDPSKDTIVIVDIENEMAVRGIVQVLPTVDMTPRVVVVTTLLTWCGERSVKYVSDAESGFTHRNPLQSSLNIYALENALWKVATDAASNGVIVCFAGLGLLYGSGGEDFEETYRETWNDMCSNTDSTNAVAVKLPFLDPETKGNILATHIDTFLDSIVHLACEYETTSSPRYFPLVDDIHKSTINCHAFEADQTIGSMPRENVIARLWEHPRLMLFNANVWFKQEPSTVLVASTTESSWKQFLAFHKLAPCRLLIAGAPFSGKTEISKRLSSMLDLKYVDLVDSLRWAANQNDDSGVRRSLLEAMNAQLSTGTKKGGAPAVCDPSTFDFSVAFIASMPSTLLRQCIAQRIAICSHCNVKGFVLDVWSVPDIVGNAGDFCELLNLVAVDPQPESAATDAVSRAKVTTDVIVLEVESDEKHTLVDRCMKSLGVTEADNKAKLSKEIQSSLKDLESRLDKYWSKLRETGRTPETAAADPVEQPRATRLSHGALLDAGDAVAFRSSSLDAVRQTTLDEAVAHAMEHTVQRIHGDMGWIAASSLSIEGEGPAAVPLVPFLEQASESSATSTPPAAVQPGASRADGGTAMGDDLRQINAEIAGLGEEERRGLISTCAEVSQSQLL